MERVSALAQLALFCGLLSALSACGDAEPGSLSGLGVDDGASEGIKKTQDVDGTKDVRIELDTGALLDLPAGAVDKNVKIGVERPADSKALKLVENLKSPGRIVSAPYVLTPHGTTFKENVTITLPLAKANNKNLAVAWLADEKDTQWKLLGVPKSNGEKAAITLKHFSVVLLVESSDELLPMDEPGATELDAGGAERDAGSDEFPRDAGVELPATDAQVRADAGGQTTPVVDAGPNASGFYARLQQCQLLEREGSVQEPQAFSGLQRCYLDCLLRGSCEDVRYLACGDIDATDGGLSVGAATCVQGCSPSIVTCPEQTSALRCDGYPSCLDGSDEVNCGDLYFECAAPYPVFSEQHCDGVDDCYLGEDELNCPHHMCDGTSFAPSVVCDGYADCLDGSDEPATCAKLACAHADGGAEPDESVTGTTTVASDGGLR